MRWDEVAGTNISEIYGFPLTILMKERNLFFLSPKGASVAPESRQLFLGTVLKGGKGWNETSGNLQC